MITSNKLITFMLFCILFLTGILKCDSQIIDIYPGEKGSYPDDFTAVGKFLFFTANDQVHGNELWKTDGTIAGTTIVKDIRVGSKSSFPEGLMNFNGSLYFFVASELWKSDGTENGTVRVKEILKGKNQPSEIVPVQCGKYLFFNASDGVHGEELWRTDGTEAGTVMVTDICAGKKGSFVQNLIGLNGTLFFFASDGTSGSQLWKSDGTAEGTKKLKAFNPGNKGGLFIHEITTMGDHVYFSANTSNTNEELWKSDGTEEGTVFLKLITRNNRFGHISDFTPGDNMLFFSAEYGEYGREVWRTDGTEVGTIMLKDFCPGTCSGVFETGYNDSDQRLIYMNGVLYYWGRITDEEGNDSDYIVRTKGSPDDTKSDLDRRDKTDFIVSNGELFIAKYAIERISGDKPERIHKPENGILEKLFVVNDQLYTLVKHQNKFKLFRFDPNKKESLFIHEFSDIVNRYILIDKVYQAGNSLVFTLKDDLKGFELYLVLL